MTNFKSPYPIIDKSKTTPLHSNINRAKAVDDIVKIIRENQRLVEKASKEILNENLHR